MCLVLVAMLVIGLLFVESALYRKLVPGKAVSLSEYRNSERVGALIGGLVFLDSVISYYQHHDFLTLVAGTVLVLGGFLGYLLLNPKLGLVYKEGETETTLVVTYKARAIIRAWAYGYMAAVLFMLCVLGN